MDKFGIFNLLSSFLGQSFNKESGSAPYSYSASPPLADKSDGATAETRATLPPLQNSMLNTMKNHDEFVKRVLTNNKKP